MCRWMSPRVIVDKRFMLWATLGLAAAYASFIALSPRLPSESDEWLLLLFGEGLFAGPMLIAAVLSLLLSRRAARMGLLVFALGYSALTAIVWYSTFSGEHDAQYQLALLVI